MATDIVQPLRIRVDIRKGLVQNPQNTILMMGDKNANRIIAELYDGNTPVTLSGVTVTGKFIRPPDGAEVPLQGEANGNEASVTLIDQCYATEGQYEANVILTSGNARRTILTVTGDVHRSGSGAYVDVSGVIPSVDDILAQYATMQQVTQATETARDEAIAETERVAAVREDAEHAVEDAQRAILLTQNWGNVTVTVSMLSPDETPVVTLRDTGTGKTMAFELPRGLTGLTPELRIGTVTTLDEGEQARATITGTAEAPVLNLWIPRGYTGSLDNMPFYDGMPSPLGEAASPGVSDQVARGDHVHPLPEHVPDADKLGGKAPEYYIQPRNLLDNSDFRNPVNQRAYTTYNTTGYTIDRWLLYYSDWAYFTIENGLNFNVSSAGCSFYQRIAANAVTVGDKYTLAYMLDGFVHVQGWIFEATENEYYDLAFIIPEGTHTLLWAALYEGSYTAETLPPYVPKGYAAELAECQRYFVRFGSTGGNNHIGYAQAATSTVSNAVLCLSQSMRIYNPTVTLDGDLVLRNGVTDIKATSITVNSLGSGAFAYIAVNAVDLVVGTMYAVRLVGATLDFSADL